ncbi:hypothetical protein CW304_04970 [Bacillus sp. UFRGS-B20]|nr:hypothetical protein CW304_04970 [Bacillus sp. UFRGS-B20]
MLVHHNARRRLLAADCYSYVGDFGTYLEIIFAVYHFLLSYELQLIRAKCCNAHRLANCILYCWSGTLNTFLNISSYCNDFFKHVPDVTIIVYRFLWVLSRHCCPERMIASVTIEDCVS